MATTKQISFIERLLSERECGDLNNTLEAQTIRSGLGENLSTRQASQFIDLLLAAPDKAQMKKWADRDEYLAAIKPGQRIKTEYGDCVVNSISQTRGIFYVIMDDGSERRVLDIHIKSY